MAAAVASPTPVTSLKSDLSLHSELNQLRRLGTSHHQQHQHHHRHRREASPARTVTAQASATTSVSSSPKAAATAVFDHKSLAQALSDATALKEKSKSIGGSIAHTTQRKEHPAPIWVFGYGSIIWRPGFVYSKRVEGYIKDYSRVFHQGNTDHRGTPDFPGRTVTLEHQPGAVTWGVAFCIEGDREAQRRALEYLDVREQQYDVRTHLPFYTDTADSPLVAKCLVYIASPNPASNPMYLGPAPLEELARQIAFAKGPSGHNHVYLFRLAEAMREMGVKDEELFHLDKLTRMLVPVPVWE
eukprot:jgi/Chlat1/4924/Chrsp31S04842